MTFRKITPLSFVLVFVAISLVWLRASLRERKSQAMYQATVALYSRDLRPGITRDDVRRLLSRRETRN